MARSTGATVLIILIATVSVCTCAIIAGAALGRTKVTLSDRALRVSVSFRGLAEDLAKELWGANHRAGRSGRALHGGGDGRSVPRTNRARDDVHTRAAARPWSRHSNFSDEITDERRPGGRGVIKVGPWGGPGGKAFYMRGGRGMSVPRVRTVAVHYTDAIHSFQQSFDETEVMIRTQQPVGGGSVPVRTMINFASDEQLIAVEGTYGHCSSVPAVVITSLTFRTDKGTTYGPYGKKTGTPFSIQAAANGCIIGFWGRSGWLLDAIGVYIRPCQAHNAAS